MRRFQGEDEEEAPAPAVPGWSGKERFRHAYVVLESAGIREFRRRGGLALSGDPRGVVVLVSDVALLSGRHDRRQPRAGCPARGVAAGRNGRDRRGIRFRRAAHQHAVGGTGRPHRGDDQGAEPGVYDRVRRRPPDRTARTDPRDFRGHRHRGAQGVRPSHEGGGRRTGLGRRPRHQLPPERADPPQSGTAHADRRRVGRLAVRHPHLRPRPGLPQIQQPLLPVSVRLALHRPRLPGALYVLPVAAGDDRAFLPHPLGRERDRGSAGHAAPLSRREGGLLRRRHVHRGPETGASHRREDGGAGSVLVHERARQRGLRNPQGVEGRRVAPVRGGLRVRQRRHSQEHQEGRRPGDGAALHQGLPRAGHQDSRGRSSWVCRARPARPCRRPCASRAR